MQLLPFLNSYRVQTTATSMSLSEVYQSIEQCPHRCLCLAFSHSLTGLFCYFPPPNPFSSPSRCRVTSQQKGDPASALPSEMCSYFWLKDIFLLTSFFFAWQINPISKELQLHFHKVPPQRDVLTPTGFPLSERSDGPHQVTRGGCKLNSAVNLLSIVYW